MKIKKKKIWVGGRGWGFRSRSGWGGGVRVDVNGEVFVKIKKKCIFFLGGGEGV